ncbi:unnamed protein product [Cyclocybe aegerita]|uniref:Tetratricopeptide repeat protein 1 n=1 Tax=Cyclocybe aegerita TaxID=1973307 RepID=A0A8S0WE82_CYCAE|nr:unnamed protein product [Cyclocybe aegerita]
MSESEQIVEERIEVEPLVDLETAKERKLEGNDHFRAGKWNDALVAYRAALNCLPKRPPKPQEEGQRKGLHDDLDEESPPRPKEDKDAEVADVSSPAVSEADKEHAQLRAVLNANIGACFVKLGDHKEVVEACSQALLDDPTYVKALERRASANEILNTWSSLTSAQEDYNTLLKLVSPSQATDIRRKLQHFKPRVEAAQKKETDEMLSKLKGLGNSILGNFGLSTDNFKFEPNGQGGYSMNFQR